MSPDAPIWRMFGAGVAYAWTLHDHEARRWFDRHQLAGGTWEEGRFSILVETAGHQQEIGFARPDLWHGVPRDGAGRLTPFDWPTFTADGPVLEPLEPRDA